MATQQISTPKLSRSEWAAVSSALAEVNNCGCGPTRVGRLFRRKAAAPLADPRREAVRAFVCEASARRAAPVTLSASLADHGFSDAQIRALALLSI